MIKLNRVYYLFDFFVSKSKSEEGLQKISMILLQSSIKYFSISDTCFTCVKQLKLNPVPSRVKFELGGLQRFKYSRAIVEFEPIF